MNDLPIHFAHPELVHAIWLWAFVLLLLIVFERRGSDALDRLVGVALQARLVDRPSRWRRWARIALLGASGLSMVVALMQPQFGLRYVATPRVGAEIMIALDVSRSMLADDAKPSRLERAKAEISDLLSYLDDDYVGLIAFAGRATVLSPMTPDKSFLRLALDSAGPHSVTRGGTRLAEPISRAVAGMGQQGPAQRALILITDGEDHDSFALDAARSAAEAGIKIIAIGFGDEGGSQIDVRDPKTGARSRLRDGEGRAVVSRLDGALLREIALVTDGAFVPAGTGVLDLASIYDRHIAALTRGQLDERGRSIRDEAFQLFVLLAILFLLGAVSTSAGRRKPASPTVWPALVMSIFLSSSGPAHAQVTGDPRGAVPDLLSESDAQDLDATLSEDMPATSSSEDPRARFNRANEMLSAEDAIGAAALFRQARREAKEDLPLRYAATYNLGMAAVARADALRADEPREALAALYEAADWFREAAAARPEEADPRHNLDVTLRRALILSDEIGRGNEPDFETELDELIAAQRERVAQAALLLEQLFAQGELDGAEFLRPAFRDAATQQRLLLADASDLAERIDAEQRTLDAIPEEQRSAEDVLGSAQLQAVLVHLDSAIDRMGKTRRQLRQRRAERAYRRGSSALADLKRARDQLRDPVEQIGILLSEVGRLAATTNRLAGSGLGDESGAPRRPRTLTRESTEAESRQLEARVDELATRFGLAAEQAARSGDWASQSGSPENPDPAAAAKQEAERIAIILAEPDVAKAASAMQAVSEAIGEGRYAAALTEEVEAGEALSAAQERFFDLRKLLNVLYADEERVVVISASDDPEAAQVRREHVDRLLELQSKNLSRAERLRTLLDRERDARIAGLEAESAPGEANPEAIDREHQLFDVADQRLAIASGAMMQVADALAEPSKEVEFDWKRVNEAAARASEQIDAIRSLFLTIAEHVRRLAVDQTDVRDRTQDAIALAAADRLKERPPDPSTRPDMKAESGETIESEATEGPAPTLDAFVRDPATRDRTEPLATEQGQLESRGGQIADALFVQAEEAASMSPDPAGPATAQESEATRDRIRQAAEHVALAQLSMGEARDTLAEPVAPLAPAQDAQSLAITELEKALALLSPPPPPPQDESDSDQRESGDGDDSGEEDQAQEGPSPSTGEPEDREEQRLDDPSQLLQGVRDREAERRRERDRDDQRRRSEPVDKDW